MKKVGLEKLGALAQEVLVRMEPKESAWVVALRGELGAGKTTFVRALAKELGVVGAVQSPTYVLMRRYRTSDDRFRTLVHIDAYRLEKPEEFAALRPEEFLGDPGTLVMVEWPERLASQLPAPDLTLNFSSEGTAEGERYIEVV